MKKLLLIPLLLFCVTAFGQWTKPQLYSNINTNIRLKTYSPTRMAALLDSLVATMNTSSFTLTNGNGTTANGSAVDLGGTQSANISIFDGTGTKTWNIQYPASFRIDTSSGETFNMSGGSGITLAASAGVNLISSNLSFTLGSDATGDTYYRNSSGYFTRLPVGTNGHVLTLSGGLPSWAAPTAGALSAITAATGSNTINNAANAQEWQWNTLAAGTGLLLSSSSTAAASNTNTVFRVNQTGANGTSTQTTHSAYFSNTKTGTSSTNIAGYFTASGGSTNYAIRTAGSVEITGSASQVPLYVRANATANGVQVASDGFTFNPIVSSNTGLGSTALRWGNSYLLRLFLGQAFPGSTETLYTLPNNSTGLTSEIIDNRLSSARTVSYTLNGTISRQAFTLIEAPTSIAGSVATTTITNAYSLYVQDLPTAGSNLAYTNKWTAGFAGNVFIGGNTSFPVSGYLNIGTTLGSGGYGFRDNAGTMEFKNSGGAWAAFGGGGIGGSTGATDNSILRADGTGGSTLQSSGVSIDDSANPTLGTASLSGNRTISAINSTSDANLTLTSQGTVVVDVAASAESFQVITTNDRVVINPAGFQIFGEKLNASATSTFLVSAAAGISGATSGQNMLIQAGGGFASGNTNGGHIYLNYAAKNGSGLDGNIGFLTNSVSDWKSMERGIFIGNRLTAPTAGIANGVALIAEDVGSNSELYTYSETGAKFNVSGLVESVLLSGTTLTLSETHRGKVIYCTSGSAVTITVPASLQLGYNTVIMQDGTGTVSLTTSGGAVVNGKTATTGQYDTIGLVLYKATDTYLGR